MAVVYFDTDVVICAINVRFSIYIVIEERCVKDVHELCDVLRLVESLFGKSRYIWLIKTLFVDTKVSIIKALFRAILWKQ